VVGAPRHFGVRGAAYVFSRSGSAWTQRAVLSDAAGEVGDRLGTSVAMSSDGSGGQSMLIGAKHKSLHGAYHNGAAILYRSSSKTATITSEGMLAPSSGDGALIGGVVALTSSLAIVGSYGPGCFPMPGEICAASPDYGKVYVYAPCGGATAAGCSLAQILKPPAGDPVINRFGAAVAIDGASVALSSPDAATSGRVYVYHHPCAMGGTCPQGNNSDSVDVTLLVVAVVAVIITAILVGTLLLWKWKVSSEGGSSRSA